MMVASLWRQLLLEATSHCLRVSVCGPGDIMGSYQGTATNSHVSAYSSLWAITSLKSFQGPYLILEYFTLGSLHRVCFPSLKMKFDSLLEHSLCSTPSL